MRSTHKILQETGFDSSEPKKTETNNTESSSKAEQKPSYRIPTYHLAWPERNATKGVSEPKPDDKPGARFRSF